MLRLRRSAIKDQHCLIELTRDGQTLSRCSLRTSTEQCLTLFS